MQTHADVERKSVHGFLVLLVLATAGALGTFLWEFVGPPSPRGVDAPEEVFSAARARGVLRLLAGDEPRPHPLASIEATLVRERLLGELRALGYEPQLQETRASQGGRVVAPLVNVMARREGSDPAHTILCVAHYDSVAAGPGIGDDLSGCAALLEVARMVRTWQPPRSNVAFLFTDGEEVDLLGAAAFAAEHPWMESVAVVLNVEARGTSGPSYLFETGPRDGWLVELYGAHARRPATTSLAREIYEHMPNDTDFTVFRAHDRSGANFAFIEDVERYHTPLDSLENLSDASLQHHGDNLEACLRGLWEEDLSIDHGSERVWFDVVGRFVLALSPTLVSVLASVALLVAALAALRGLAWRELDFAGLLGAMAGPPALVGAVVLVVGLVAALLRLATGAENPWLAQPLAGWLVLGGAVLFTFAVFVRALSSGARGTLGTWLAFAGAAFALALLSPGVSFLVLVPAVLLALLGPLGGLHREGAPARATLALSFTMLASLCVWTGALRGLVAAFGLERIELLAGGFAALATLLAPLLASASTLVRRSLGLLGWIGLLVGAGLTVLRPLHDRAHPAPLNLDYALDTSRDQAWWIARPSGIRLPSSIADAGPLARARMELEEPWALFGSEGYVGATPPLAFVPPVFEVTKRVECGELVLLSGRVRSPAGADATYLALTARSEPVAIAVEPDLDADADVDTGPAGVAAREREPEREKERPRGPRPHEPLRWVQASGEPVAASSGEWIAFVGLGHEGVEVELALARGATSELLLIDRHRGLPAEGAPLERARHGAGCVPIGNGDGTLILARVPLGE